MVSSMTKLCCENREKGKIIGLQLMNKVPRKMEERRSNLCHTKKIRAVEIVEDMIIRCGQCSITKKNGVERKESIQKNNNNNKNNK